MSEGEFFEFLNSSVGVTSDSWAAFITGFFAYIICAYLVGRKISPIQSAALTTAYSIYTALHILTIFYVLERIGSVGSRHSEFYPQHERAEFFAYTSVSLMLFVWLMSVIYMISENRKKDEPAV